MAELRVLGNEFEKNVKIMQSAIGKDKSLMYVAKANCYGLSPKVIIPRVNCMLKRVAVATLDEAHHVAMYCDKMKILCLLPQSVREMEESIVNGYTITVSSLREMDQVIRLSKLKGMVAKVELKIESGMNRFGMSTGECVEDILNLARMNRVVVQGAYTHLLSTDSAMCDQQVVRFLSIVGNANVPCHLTFNEYTANSLNRLPSKFTGYRSGIMSLGGVSNSLGLSQCFKLTGRILSINNVNTAECVGYDFGYIAKKPMRIAVVDCGYGDISIRKLANKGKVLVNGKFCDIIGNICMDVLFCDVSKVNCDVFDEVEIINEKELSIVNIAKQLDTIPYDVLTSISSRVRRVDVHKKTFKKYN